MDSIQLAIDEPRTQGGHHTEDNRGGVTSVSVSIGTPNMPSLATLVAEKPSYSRGPDGKYPKGVASFQKTISDLRSETLKQSTMARTMGRRSEAPRGYMLANTSHQQIEVVQQQEQAFRKREEQARQAAEKANLAKAYQIEKARFEAQWALKIEQVERECEERERVLKEVHEIARAGVEKDIAKSMKDMRFRASSALLQMNDMEAKLATAQEFKQAAEVAARAIKLRQAEEAEFERFKAGAGKRPREECRAAQATEMRNCVQKNHSLRLAVRREKEEAFLVFQQKYRNLELDLQHASAIEWSLRPEIGAVQAQKSRSTQASTFRGTLKYESLAGTKFDVPDVSKLAGIPADENSTYVR